MTGGTSARSGSAVHRLKAPWAAGLAGVVFAILFAATLILVNGNMPHGGGAGAQWSAGRHTAITTASVLMPFAGISFLWFLAVVRDGFGLLEDRFYATVFLGSGLLFLAMMFVSTAVAAGLVAADNGVADLSGHAAVIEFAGGVFASVSKTFALRMAAVFMISLATIWLKTALMPRWLALLTYAAALILLTAGDVSVWATLAMPAWVLIASVLILLRARHLDLSRAVPAASGTSHRSEGHP
ncbi:hypothetical protein OS121_17275 [Mycolicibacterium mucogenicum]|uniref:hypothetical protein n=1 Tax=Mycolicibacterium mucogenicum TaxID=56689 RepID=UPI0022698B2A|nr:hypothetical protein [Mycolicibacterium mucogenicum]MCX8556814.1 hypothetical protein [Mycolicibacterium mucogenicum]